MRRILELIPFALLAACADVNSVVGGACAEGYVEQGNACVLAPLATGSGDAGAPNADAGSGDTDGGGSDRSRDGGAQTGSDASSTTSTSTAIDPSNLCTPPEIVCGGVCVDTSSDPNNCGSCGKVCPSNACVAGKCVGSAPGHVVVIGHDYETSPTVFSSQARVLTNATLLPASNPLRVMSYEEFADAPAVQNAEGLVTAEAKQLGRTVSFASVGASSTVSSTLDQNAFDVLLVHDQRRAPSGTLATIGSAWQADGHVAAFLHAGGVVIVLTGGGGTGEMPALASNAGLLDVTAQTAITGSLTVLAPADAIGSGVVSPYVPKPSTVTLDTEANGGDVVWVVAQNGAPVVVHKVMP
ncbi:MAG TPA: hypothetical protein VGH28_34110 [Polyangiaceae bacterium]